MNKVKLIMLVFCIVLLCGCNNKKCIISHQETIPCVRPQCIFMNRNPICINQVFPCEQTICDEYEGEDDERN